MNDPFDREDYTPEWNGRWDEPDRSYRRPERKGRGLVVFAVIMLLLAALCLGAALWLRAGLARPGGQDTVQGDDGEPPVYPQQSTRPTQQEGDPLYGRDDAPELTLYSRADSALFGVQESGLSIPEIAKMVSPAVVGVVADSGTGVILGAQLMCQRATDLISQFTAAVVNGLTAEQLRKVMRPHPTFDEGIGEALEDLEEKLGRR